MTKQLSWLGLLAMFGDIFWDEGQSRNRIPSRIYWPGDGRPCKKEPPHKRFREEEFNEPIHNNIRKMLNMEDVEGMVVFECHDMCSSHIGERRGVIFGSDCTFETLDMALWSDYDGEKKQPRRIDMELASTQKVAVGYYLRREPDGVDRQDEECLPKQEVAW